MRSWISPALPPLSAVPSAPPLELFDSSQREVVTSPRDPNQKHLGLYVCGITPYDATHLGHAATYVAFDLLNRVWRDRGYAVTYIQNVTDVDDPLLERARETGQDWTDLAAEQIELFREDMEALRVLPPTHYLGAVETIPEVVEAIEKLLEIGIAYRVALPHEAGGDNPELGDVYFDTAAAPHLGEISRLDRASMLELFAERGGDPTREGKRDQLDPLLWRRARTGEPHWPGNTLGTGRPGWHIECAVIAANNLPIPFEVQGGGSDLIFPHHEMSAIHGEALCTADRFANRFMHSGMVGYQGEKMSKSRGNLEFVSRLRRNGTDPMAIRLALLSQHYRSDWEWTQNRLERAEVRLSQWRAIFADCDQDSGPVPGGAKVIAAIRSALAVDLNAPQALEAIDAWVKSEPKGTAERVGDTASLRDVREAIDALLGIQ